MSRLPSALAIVVLLAGCGAKPEGQAPPPTRDTTTKDNPLPPAAPAKPGPAAVPGYAAPKPQSPATK